MAMDRRDTLSPQSFSHASGVRMMIGRPVAKHWASAWRRQAKYYLSLRSFFEGCNDYGLLGCSRLRNILALGQVPFLGNDLGGMDIGFLEL